MAIVQKKKSTKGTLRLKVRQNDRLFSGTISNITTYLTYHIN